MTELDDGTGTRARFAILDQAPNAFLALSPEWVCLYINAVGARLLGQTREAMMGRNIWEVFPEAVGGSFWHTYHRAMQERVVVGLEEYYGPLGGWFEVKAYPIDTGIGVHFSNVTERKELEATLRESEARFQQLANNIHEVFWLTDLDVRRVVYVSPAYESIWGRSRQSLYDATDGVVHTVHADDAERVTQSLSRRGSGDYDEQFRIVRPDGSVRWIRARIYPVRNAQGNVFRVAGVAEDITEQRRLEEQLRQSQKMEAIGRLAGGIAHDFNNILSVVVGYSTLAAANLPAGDPLRDDIVEIEKAGLRAADLTAQLLAFSRQQVLKPSIIDLNESVTKVERLLRRVLGSHIELETGSSTPLWPVRADPGQIDQVLMNLAVNARDAMPAGGKLTVLTCNVDLDDEHAHQHSWTRPGQHVMLSVADTGVGMDRATQAQMFEPFFTTKEAGKGSGLGLSTVFGIVQQSGGSIQVDSEMGRGATFRIYFPRCDSL
jgi:PAS domain S-box-containing protein